LSPEDTLSSGLFLYPFLYFLGTLSKMMYLCTRNAETVVSICLAKAYRVLSGLWHPVADRLLDCEVCY